MLGVCWGGVDVLVVEDLLVNGTSRKSAKVEESADAGPTLLAGGNPQIAKGDGDAPVHAYIEAMPGWKRDVGRRLHEDDQLDEELLASWIRQASELPGWAGFRR